VAEERTFQIQLEGLIQLLAQNLYADPDVFLREMIQNAHDSINRRAELARERAEPAPPAPRIQIVADAAAREIQIHDNGSGLTTDEIDSYLSTIGRSGTDELRQRIAEADRTRTVELIGQFGIGLLSAFIVADRVTVDTRAGGGEPLHWESRGDRNYTVQHGNRDQVGTTVTLHVTPEHGRYLERARLATIIRTYADFIGMPVYLNDDAEPANAVNAPWHRDYLSQAERDSAYRAFWEKKFAGEDALHVIAVDQEFSWPDLSRPGGQGHGRVRGVLAITNQHIPDVNARGTVDVYLSRMFIGAANREVLPPWAKFLRGVIECNQLTPNAARDNVVHNAALAAVQKVLGELVVAELMALSRQDRDRLVEIMRWHSFHLLMMAVRPEHEDFFRAVADLMPLESDQGPLTVPEYLRTAPDSGDGSRLVHYIAERGAANQYFLLASARGIRVFNCAENFAERFLELYAAAWPHRVTLRRLDVAGSETIFEPLDEDEADRFAYLEAACGLVFPDGRYIASVSRFQPAELPAVLTETRDSKHRRELTEVAGNLMVPQFLRVVVQGYLAEEREPLMLHLNAANPTIQRLAAWPDLRDEVSQQAMTSLYNNALMLLARTLPVETVREMFAQYNQVIDLMLLLAAERAQLQGAAGAGAGELGGAGAATAAAEASTAAVSAAEASAAEASAAEVSAAEASAAGDREAGLDPYVSCFVTMPAGDPRAAEIYDAARAVLEHAPYYWRVERAGDFGPNPVPWPDHRERLLGAHCYLAILGAETDLGVLVDVGRMQALDRPLLILTGATEPGPPPSLAGIPRAVLQAAGDQAAGDQAAGDQAAGDQLRAEVASALAREPGWRALRARDRYLSSALLSRDAGLSEQASEQISRRYPAWQGFLNADPATVADQAGISRHLVNAVKATLEDLRATQA
jgi:HSP90 family molecular chaperone